MNKLFHSDRLIVRAMTLGADLVRVRHAEGREAAAYEQLLAQLESLGILVGADPTGRLDRQTRLDQVR